MQRKILMKQIKINKWGTSAAIRLSKTLLELLDAQIGDVLDVEMYGSRMIIKKDTSQKEENELFN